MEFLQLHAFRVVKHAAEFVQLRGAPAESGSGAKKTEAVEVSKKQKDEKKADENKGDKKGGAKDGKPKTAVTKTVAAK